MMMIFFRYITYSVFNLCMVMLSPHLFAQQKDSLQHLKHFIKIMSSTSAIPLDMDMDMHYSANLVTQPEDTIVMEAKVCLRLNESYIRMGEQEQITSDSAALLVSDSLHRMLFYPNAILFVDRMRKLPGLQWSDSSVRKLAAQYRINVTAGEIVLDGRTSVPGSHLPSSGYLLTYNSATNKPEKLVMVQRHLLEMEEEEYLALQRQPGLEKNLFTINGQFYLVKERSLTINYRKVGEPGNNALPFTIADRVERTGDGQYKPVKKYEDYQIVSAN